MPPHSDAGRRCRRSRRSAGRGPILLYAQAFAAGAMIYVAIKELIAESHREHSRADLSMLGTVGGFTVMMILDMALKRNGGEPGYATPLSAPRGFGRVLKDQVRSGLRGNETSGLGVRLNSDKDSSSIDVKRDARDESIRHQHEGCGRDVLGGADATDGQTCCDCGIHTLACGLGH